MKLRCTRCGYAGASTSFVAGAAFGDVARCRFCRASALPVQITVAGADAGVQSPSSPAPAPAPALDSAPGLPVSFMGQATPEDVQAGKLRLNPYVSQMTAAISSCSSDVPRGMQAAWSTWAGNWATFYASPSSYLKASSDMNRLAQSRAELTSFENQLLKICPDAGIVSLDAEPPGTLARIGSAITSITIFGAIFVVAGTGLAGWLIYVAVKEAAKNQRVLFEKSPELLSSTAKIVPFL